MPWFRLEDGFYAHPKVEQAGNAPVGLWIRCATYSAHYLTDGVIPAGVAARMGRRRDIDALTAAHLWVPVDNGFAIPDWSEYQPSAAHVKERRKADAERKRLEREAAGRDPVTGRYLHRPTEEE